MKFTETFKKAQNSFFARGLNENEDVTHSHTHTNHKSNKDNLTLTDITLYQKATTLKIEWKWKNTSVEQNRVQI